MVSVCPARRTLGRLAVAFALLAAGFTIGRSAMFWRQVAVVPSGVDLPPEKVRQRSSTTLPMQQATTPAATTRRTTPPATTMPPTTTTTTETAATASQNEEMINDFASQSLPLLPSSARSHVTSTIAISTTPSPEELRRLMASAFRLRMSTDEKKAALRCLGELDAALRNASVTYFLYSGTLLGARRHRGMVPWDDDIDVLANYTQLRDLERALQSVAGYELVAAHRNRYKFYSRGGRPITGKMWRWPYVDLCFFGENATHVYDIYPGLRDEYIYAKADVFPLVYRPFNGLILPTPANEERVLARNYDVRTCQTHWFSHRNEAQVSASDVMSVPCTELYSMHPFIFRNGTTPPVGEVLKIGDWIVEEFVTY